MSAAAAELPAHKRPTHRRAVRLEWITLGYLVTAIVAIFLTLGNSQAMKAAWIEDILSLLPATVFLIADRIRRRRPSTEYPWGYHRAVSIAYLAASLALLVMGAFILYDSLVKLVTAEHPPIGTVSILGRDVWLGWLMLPALAWSAIPAFVIGRIKMPLAAELHDKVLYADAQMNKADWLTASAAAVGVIGIAFGFWFADALAACAISLDILHDGWKNVRVANADLMDRRPRTYDGAGVHPLLARVENELRGRSWTRDARVRLREMGHVLGGEALVVPSRSDERLLERLEREGESLRKLDWKLEDVVIVPVEQLEPYPGDRPPEDRPA
jgi:cation diffusion facilitator family transporter